MTLVLKSNVRATNNAGNIHGMIGPTDYVGMLDFAAGEYFTVLGGERTDYSMAQAASVARSSAAPYRLRDGVLRSVPANTLRRQYMPGYDSEGIQIAATCLGVELQSFSVQS